MTSSIDRSRATLRWPHITQDQNLLSMPTVESSTNRRLNASLPFPSPSLKSRQRCRTHLTITPSSMLLSLRSSRNSFKILSTASSSPCKFTSQVHLLGLLSFPAASTSQESTPQLQFPPVNLRVKLIAAIRDVFALACASLKAPQTRLLASKSTIPHDLFQSHRLLPLPPSCHLSRLFIHSAANL